ncbi:Arylsulfatase [Pontiella desulfatans]|uniref:Arylsulfatase n=1 Tax=Pontiella desulfatans TaxID=2750659 RepID=A0A6C2U3C9_PONDE|nr:sulfatase-like hydrolase/transferase [Pontiella desulfatans]SPS73933.1 sulfatase S1_51 [Kiritimatiellales bacterium]VGO14512.1 Arylsulfatase [Pontiella desulfatans]
MKTLALVFALLAAHAWAGKPNVIFFITDDMLPHHFNFIPGVERKVLTPNIERIADEGVVLLNQYTVSPLCTPSRYSVLTGRNPSRANNPFFKETTEKNGGQTHVEFNTHILETDESLPQLMKRAGYMTGFVGKNHVIEVQGLKRFPDNDASAKDPKNQAQLKANHDKVCQGVREVGFDYVDRVYHNNPHFLGLHEVAVHNMDWITGGGTEFIRNHHDRSEPFFLYFATTLPHGPVNATSAWNANPLLSAVGYLDEAPAVQPARKTIPERIRAAGLKPTDDACNLLWMDDALGALLDTLEETGQLENTLIFFFNDQWMESKGTVYQGGVHTPGIVWRKGGFPVGKTCDALLNSIDFAPTILDAVGGDYADAALDGESFWPYLTQGKKQPEGRVLYFELGFGRGILKGDWKYVAIRYPEHIANMSKEERVRVLEEWNANRRRLHIPIVTEDPAKPFSHLTAIPGGGHAEMPSTGTEHYPGYYDPDQLYRISRDPHEQVNLANDPEYKDKLEEMMREMKKIQDALPGDFGL